MIASVRGRVLAASGTTVVVEVGGVGYRVLVTPDHALELRVGSEATVTTALIVRDDELTLYGFRDEEQRGVFDLLISVSGVGPKSAMGVLGTLSVDEIAAAVAHEDEKAFRRVSGIGPKTAKLIILSLAGKLAVTAPAAPRAASTVGASVITALAGLGWPERAAAQAVDEAIAAASEHERADLQALLRIALANLGTVPGAMAGKGQS